MSVRKRLWEGGEAWNVDYRDQLGKRRLKTFRTKREAEAFRDHTSVDIRRGVHTPDSASISIAKAGELWLESCAALERSTLVNYRRYLELHITPRIGTLKLSALSLPGLRQFEDQLKTEVSAVTRKKIMMALGAILADAQERGHVAQNVAHQRRAKKDAGARHERKLEVGVDIPTPAEIRALIAALKPGRNRALLLTAIFSGLRASELRGLRWIDVDLERNEIHVRQRADRYDRIGPPKSVAGRRTVPIIPMVANALREWKMQKGTSELVFPGRDGRCYSHGGINSRIFKPSVMAAGLLDADGGPKYSGVHTLRHFYASWSINRKADGGLELPLAVAQKRLGHARINMTVDRYGHLFPTGDTSDEMRAAERSFFGA